ncbi:hypothetical protein [Sphingomonas hylomeconis]|uniref:DUF3617 domain-containing protein n=1 Tax=Sphingomonas hylomeconis TaxID=1395958 RepID=A0ABV7SWN7_9SPHN|nr:hypothetical protein [Sphingomonas hylomeconis]
MPNPLPPALLLMLVAPGAADPPRGSAPAPRGWGMTQLTIRQRIIIRTQKAPARVSRPLDAAPTTFPVSPRVSEKKGPKCVPIERLAGTGVARKDNVDLLLTDGTMLRARLGGDCPTLDFYAGIYLRQTPDGQLCSDRDVIRARSGRACPISTFKRLKPKK